MNQHERALRVAQEYLDSSLLGAVALLPDGLNLPRFAEWAALELHVFNVPEGANVRCIKELLRELRVDLFTEDEVIILYPHSCEATCRHYTSLLPPPRVPFPESRPDGYRSRPWRINERRVEACGPKLDFACWLIAQELQAPSLSAFNESLDPDSRESTVPMGFNKAA